MSSQVTIAILILMVTIFIGHSLDIIWWKHVVLGKSFGVLGNENPTGSSSEQLVDTTGSNRKGEVLQ